MKLLLLLGLLAGLLLPATSLERTIQIGTGPSSFPCRLTPLADAPADCQAYSFTFPSAVQSQTHPHNNTVSGELYRPLKPLTSRQAPAVVVNHIIGPGLFVIERAQCRNLARHGVTALFFHLPFYGPRSHGKGPEAMLKSPQLFASCLQQALEDSHRAVDLLLTFPDVSPRKLGVTGVSLGSLMTANAVANDSRLRKAMMILGGGNLRQIIRGKVYETLAIRQFLAQLKPHDREAILKQLDRFDPLSCAPALKRLNRRGNFLMLNADRDHIIPPDTSRQLATKVGNDIHWYHDLNHYTAMSQLGDMLRRQAEFFAQDVPAAWKPPCVPQTKNLELAAKTANYILMFTGAAPPQPHKAHLIQGAVKLNLFNSLIIPCTVRFALGSNNQFRLATADFVAGFDGQELWLTDNRTTRTAPSQELRQQTIFNNNLVDQGQLRLFQTALAFLAEAPDCLQDYLSAKTTRAKDGFTSLHLASRLHRLKATCFISFTPDELPKDVALNLEGLALTLEIHYLQTNRTVPENFFARPPQLPVAGRLTPAPFQQILLNLLPKNNATKQK